MISPLLFDFLSAAGLKMDPKVTHSRLQDVYSWSYEHVHAVHGAKVEHKTKQCNKSSHTRWEWRKNIHNSET